MGVASDMVRESLGGCLAKGEDARRSGVLLPEACGKRR